MTHSRVPNTQQTITEKWTTPSGKAIELTATVSTFDLNWKIEYRLLLDGKEMRPEDRTTRDGKSIIRFSTHAGGQTMAVVISDELNGKIDAMIADAKTELKPRENEYNQMQEAERRADRS